MHPLTEIKSIPENLHLFIPVNLTQIRHLYHGAFIRFKDNQGKMFYGGYLSNIGESSGSIVLEVVEEIGAPTSIKIPITLMVQLWKKIDFCYFELNKMEETASKIIRSVKLLEQRIEMLENKLRR